MVPIFIATARFDPSDGEKWREYSQCVQIPGLLEVVSLDSLLCPNIVTEHFAEDWNHIIAEDLGLGYFTSLEYLKQQVQGIKRRNILGLYRDPNTHVTVPPEPGDFVFLGYDLIDESTQISAITNCSGFSDVFGSDELNQVGLIQEFDHASEVKRLLAERHPDEHHAQCHLYAIWRLSEDPASLPD